MHRFLLAMLAIGIVVGLGKAQAPSGVSAAEGPVVVASLSQCYWPVTPPTTQLAVAECWVDTGDPKTSGKYFSLSSGPTIWTQENGQLTKAAVLGLGITVQVPARAGETGTLQ